MSYIAFTQNGESPSGKTKRWNVTAVSGGPPLGTVRWYGPWRKYVFQPDYAVFDADCLREIADFTESETKAHGKVIEIPVVPAP